MPLRAHLDKIGIGGSVFAALCCLGVTAAVSLLSAVGLGFLANDRVLIPLLIGFLALAIAGLALDWRHHHHPSALVLGSAAGIGLFLSAVVAQAKPAAYASIAVLVAASFLNLRLRRRPA